MQRAESNATHRNIGTFPQGEYMRRLAAGGHQDTLIALFESGRLANTEDTLGEYMKALVKTDRLSGSALLSTLVVSVAYNYVLAVFALGMLDTGEGMRALAKTDQQPGSALLSTLVLSMMSVLHVPHSPHPYSC